MTFELIILGLFYLLAPAFILWLCVKFVFLDKIGSVLIAYLFGIMLGNSGLLPEGSHALQDIIMSISIPLAIPLLLFSSDVKSWLSLAGKSFLSMIIAMAGVVVMVVAGYLLFRGSDPEFWKVGGMLVGVYTGGTPNLASLKLMLNVGESTYLLTHTYDMVLSGLYFLFLLVAGQKVFSWVLPRFKSRRPTADIQSELKTDNPLAAITKRENRIPLLKMFGLSVLILAVSGGIGQIVPESIMMVTTILLITSFGILFSLVSSVRQTDHTFDLGMYLILIFSIAVSSMVNFRDMLAASPNLIFYISFVVFGSLIFHVLVSAFFKIDTDTVMATSAALICSPPFVPVVTTSIKNKEVLVPGLTIGIIGYAVGNYLGYLIANLLATL